MGEEWGQGTLQLEPGGTATNLACEEFGRKKEKEPSVMKWNRKRGMSWAGGIGFRSVGGLVSEQSEIPS